MVDEPAEAAANQMRLFGKDQPGDSVQVDVKLVRVNRQRYFQ
jgi:hypothetical protein